MTSPRVAENLNHALHDLFGRDAGVYLLGEDVLDPYGGAFKISKGLSTNFPDRVITTPLSEGGILGVGNGLALCGNRVIVEIMFGDFLTLGFDQIMNFAAKSATMYGREIPIRLLVRCPVGGNRGYGPTHSQSLQKHLIGVPNLALYELSPFHDAADVLAQALDRGTPGVLFEDKVLYTQRMCLGDHVGDHLRRRLIGPGLGWAHLFPYGREAPCDLVIIAPGGVAHRAMAAADLLRELDDRAVHVITPAQLYPVDIEPVLPLLASAGRIVIVEESTAGGTWGAEVARLLSAHIWSSLTAPPILLNSADSIIPSAGHLERQVLLGSDEIVMAVRKATGWGGVRQRVATPSAEAGAGVIGLPVTAPKLNNNDTSYVVVDWLVDDGEWVGQGTELVSLETSKAVEDIVAPGAGYLRRVAGVGDEKGVGDLLAYLLPERADPVTPARAPAPLPPAAASAGHRAEGRLLDRAQRGTAEVVTRSHLEIPAGFTLMKVDVEDLLGRLARQSEETGTVLGLAEVVVKAVATAYGDFPDFFGSLSEDHRLVLPDAPHVGITVDTDGTLYMPTVERADKRTVADIADTLMEFRMKALGKSFAAHELTGGNISISWNPDPGVVFVQPIVMWPQLCMVSVGAVGQDRPATGSSAERRFVNIGLAYDHRVINGRAAVLFLAKIKALLEDQRSLLEG
jgi:pyruvate/2-oxoglutarate/acetoin dehydrogenase E1 component/pyruvate/2-oxoglutarate dehydrogenase complex dihydrolipoamide acyltransferase (E2) component